MTITARAYARDKNGNLAVFNVTGAISYEGAIEAVKIDLGVERALCLVQNAPKASEKPLNAESAAA